MTLLPHPVRYLLSSVVIAIAASAMIAWFAGPDWLITWGYVHTIKPVTAVCLILSAMIQLCPRSRPGHMTKVFAIAFSWLLLLVLGLTALCLLFRWCDNPTIWTPRPDLAAPGLPGQMSRASLLALMILGIYGQYRRMSRHTVVASWFVAASVGGIGLMSITGLVTGYPDLAFFREGSSNAVAMPSAVCFVLLAAGVFRIR